MKHLRWLLLLIPVTTTSCHAYVTNPMLWNHGSSGAFELTMFLWCLNLFLIVVTLFEIHR